MSGVDGTFNYFLYFCRSKIPKAFHFDDTDKLIVVNKAGIRVADSVQGEVLFDMRVIGACPRDSQIMGA